MYESLQIPWSKDPSASESAYRAAGLIKTKGTVPLLLPPAQEILEAAFDAPPRPQSRMSAGAVALCKHFERGGASSEPGGRPHPFWTLPTGSNENKSLLARQMLTTVLADAQWKNVMLLHPGVAVYEIRNALGFGMRWTLDLEEVSDEKDVGEEKMETLENVQSTTHEGGSLKIVRTTFRGFVEPIAGLDHELG